MKYAAAARGIFYLVTEYGLLGLLLMIFIAAAVSLVPAGVAKVMSDDPDTPKVTFSISAVAIFIILALI